MLGRLPGWIGTIGDTLIYEMRKQMGLSSNACEVEAQDSRQGKVSQQKCPRTVSSPGKTMFVKEFLNDHPQGNVVAVNEAWQAAGFDGTISQT